MRRGNRTMDFIANVADAHFEGAVAVIADAHFYDPACDFGVNGQVAGGGGKSLRPWQDTRAAARVYNESRAALEAALEMVIARGIRHVVLLGDYTDDGQTALTEALATMLRGYAGRLAFYAIPGNHDLYATHGKHQSMRVMARGGGTVLVTSDAEMAAQAPGAVISPAMYCQGAVKALAPMAAFGLCRRPEYLHWETPFGRDDSLVSRVFDAVSADGSVVQRVVDASYLVEPEAGLWLLMIDANVFEPRNGRADPARKQAFHDPSDAGWNAVLRVKPHLLAWIADVCARAGAAGKTLLVFSHYPVLDPFEDVAANEAALFGRTEILRRTPLPAVATALRRAGVTHVFSGHLHVNGEVHSGSLRQTAVSALVSFPPGFKTVMAADPGLRVETVSLRQVPLDAGIAAIYGDEARAENGAADYGGFLRAQMRRRVIERRVPQDWPEEIAAWALGARVADLRALMGMPGREVLDALPLGEMIADWYALRQAGGLAAEYIAAERLELYQRLAAFGNGAAAPGTGMQPFFARFLAVLGVSLRRMTRGDGRARPV